MQTQNPFKGPSSYEDGDQFYGRKEEIKDLVGLIRNETLTMLFSRSGTGKSSLLKAGLFPELRNECEFFPIYLHLNEAVVKESCGNNLCHYIIKKCKDEISQYFNDKSNFLVSLADDTDNHSLFEFIHFTVLKEVDNSTGEAYIIKPVLIFDQFEEIFTSPFDKNDLHFFLKEINCLIENELPDYLREDAMTNESSQFTQLKNTLKSKQKNFRLAFAFREEYLPQFESLRKEIPALRFTNSRYRLEPFTVETAQNIIISTSPDISSETALEVSENISTEMEGFEEKRVDPFLLSLICQIIYKDLQVVDDNRTGDSRAEIQGLVENAVETYISGVYNGINEETREFIETRLITSDGKKNSVNLNDVQGNKLLNADILRLVDDPGSRLLSLGQFLDSRHITILHDRLLPPLIQRKNERGRRNEELAFSTRKEKYDRENRRRQRVFLGIFASIIFFLALILYFANKNKNRTEGFARQAELLKEDAKASLKLANLKQHDADLLKTTNAELSFNAQRAYDKAKQDSIRNDSALKISEIKLYSQRTANDLLKSTITNLQKSIDSNFVQRDLNQLKLGSKMMDSLLFNNLFKLKNTHQDEAYIDFLYAVEDALELKSRAGSNDANSYDLLSKAKSLWKKHQANEVVDTLIRELLNTNIFYQQLITLQHKEPYENSNTFLSFSDPGKTNRSKFAFNFDNNIYLGDFQSDSISVFAFTTYGGKTDDKYADSYNKKYGAPLVDTLGPNVNADSQVNHQSRSVLSSLVYYKDLIFTFINGSLFTYSVNSNNNRSMSVPLERHDYEVLSPNGRYLVTYSDFDSVRFRDLKIFMPLSRTLNVNSYYNIKSVIFSNDSRKLLVLDRSNTFIVYNIDSNGVIDENTRVINKRTDQIMAANFTPDGKAVLAVTKRVLYIKPLKETKTDNSFDPNYPVPLVLAYNDQIRSVSLSPDSKRVLIQSAVGLIVLMKKDGQNFEFEDILKNNQDNLNYKVFRTSANNSGGAFLNSNSLVVVSDIGKVYFLKIYPEFTSLNEAFNKLKMPDLSLLERLEIDPGNDLLYTEIFHSNDDEVLISSVNTYYLNYMYPKNYIKDSMMLVKAQALYKVFIQNEKSDFRVTNLESIRNGIYLIRQLSDLDTVKRNKASYYRNTLILTKKYKNLLDSVELAGIYGNLSFYSFFDGKFSDGLRYAEKGIALDTNINNYIYTNEALGYLFNTRFSEAENLYNFYKDSTIFGRSMLFKEGFLQDLQELEDYGIIHKNDPVIWEEVKRIRKILNK